jgi:hypothetical protein
MGGVVDIFLVLPVLRVDATEGLSSCLVAGEVNASGVIKFRLLELKFRLLPDEIFKLSTKPATAKVSVEVTIMVSSAPSIAGRASGNSTKFYKILIHCFYQYKNNFKNIDCKSCNVPMVSCEMVGGSAIGSNASLHS